MDLNFQLQLEEANLILRVLSKHPFDEVVGLINKIRQQAESQLGQQEAMKKAAEEAIKKAQAENAEVPVEDAKE